MEGEVEALAPQLIGIEYGEFASLVVLGRHQAMMNQRAQEPRLAPQQPVTPSSHLARLSPLDGERSAVLGIPTIGEDAYARLDQRNGFVGFVQVQDDPAQRGRTEIESQSVSQFALHVSTIQVLDVGSAGRI